ncbi:MAG: ABC transporter ATP-binding protein [Candidatus Tectimicrobiota bacterium]
MAPLLRLEQVSKSFAGFHALQAIDVCLEGGRTACIIGPNGAGKSTLFNLITGHLRPTSGRIIFRGQDITGRPPHTICQLGIARSFQHANIFPRLSVFDNMHIAVLAHHKHTHRFFSPAARLVQAETYAVLEQVGLAEVAPRLSGTLSYGLQKQLELGLALASEPTLLLLDEPTAGMSPQETASTLTLLDHIVRQRGLTLLMTEHDMEVVFRLADSIIVLHQGQVLALGTAAEVRRNAAVQQVYLGENG